MIPQCIAFMLNSQTPTTLSVAIDTKLSRACLRFQDILASVCSIHGTVCQGAGQRSGCVCANAASLCCKQPDRASADPQPKRLLIEILCLLQVSWDTPSAAPAGALNGADGQLQPEDFSGQPDRYGYAAPSIYSMTESIMYELAIS